MPCPRRRLKNATTAAMTPAKKTNRKNFLLPPPFSLSLSLLIPPPLVLVGLDGLEPSTSSLSGMRSNQAELQARGLDGPSDPAPPPEDTRGAEAAPIGVPGATGAR